MKPAYGMPLSKDQLALLGELTVIMGQSEDDMVALVAGLVHCDRGTASKIMGSTNARTNSDIWATLIGERTNDARLLELVKHACAEMAAVQSGRNGFVHADFRAAFQFGNSWVTVRGGEDAEYEGAEVIATRIRDVKKRTHVAELRSLRDRAARLSCLVAHITYCLAPHGRDHPDKSPWLERATSWLPPLSETAALPEQPRHKHRQKPWWVDS